jgi:uncharacterized protein YqjF (DUF2071 family)
MHVLFIHFRVDRRALQSHVPFELDTHDGQAFISLVAFTQRRLRFSRGGRVLEWLSAPLASHEFLNLRTYVRVGPERGIYFIAEWIPNRLAALVGPRTYGLPYRLGRLRYRTDVPGGKVLRRVDARGASFVCAGAMDSTDHYRFAPVGSLDEFLVERYVAYTLRDGVARGFDVAHEPWLVAPINIQIIESSLPEAAAPSWWPSAHLIGAHYSPGVRDVSIGAPRRSFKCSLPNLSRKAVFLSRTRRRI